MKEINFNFCMILILALKFEKSLSTPNCLELTATNYFGFYNSCFIHAIENLKKMIVFYTSTSVTGISFRLINGQNLSYMTNMGFTKSERIDLINSYLTGVEVWTGNYGISGLKFQLYSPATSKFNFTSLLGSTNGCYSYLNSTFMQSNFFRINSIGGCLDNYVQNEFPSLNFQYSFSQCPLYSIKEISTFRTTATTTETSAASTTTTTDDLTSSTTATVTDTLSSSTTATTTEASAASTTTTTDDLTSSTTATVTDTLSSSTTATTTEASAASTTTTTDDLTSSTTATATDTLSSTTATTKTKTSTSSSTTTTDALASSTTATATETSESSTTTTNDALTTETITTCLSLTSQSNRQNIFTDDSCRIKSKFIFVNF
jgi:hypothetical protein